MRNDHDQHLNLSLAALLYSAFVVYGSLIPFDFHPRPIEDAWHKFLHMQYVLLDLGARADWVANILLYIPLSFLASAVLADAGRSGLLLGARWIIVFAACAALAVGVEFAQMFFAPRTVSLNDIVAELFGTLAGIVVWEVWGRQMLDLWSRFRSGGIGTIRAAFITYALGYLLLSLFPYDFVVSAAEFMQKLQSDHTALILVQAGCGRALVCGSKLLIEVIAVVPLGFLLSLLVDRSRTVSYLRAFLAGMLLGGLIEGAQLFVNSGISQGISVLTRGMGILFGVALHQVRCSELLLRHRHLLRPLLLLGVIPYVVTLAWLNGWLSVSWSDLDQALVSFAQVRWMPFYYHYYVTETAALLSAMAFAAMYAPMGVGWWAWEFGRGYTTGTATLRVAMGAALLAAVVEAGKLFLPGKHPDSTDVLIAACAAVIAYQIAVHFQRSGSDVYKARKFVSRQTDVGESPTIVRAGILAWVGAAALLALVGVVVSIHPLPGPWLLLGLGVYGCVIWRNPTLTLPAVLTLLPILNFAPWTGWVLLDEFDLLVGVTLAVHLLKPRDLQRDRGSPLKFGWVIGLLAVSFIISAAVGLMPLQPFGADALSGYLSSYNSLRAFKGFLWACALLPIMASQSNLGGKFENRIVAGIAVGLCAVSAVAVWERFVFSGLFNFSNDYRITATFPEMHTGGAFAEGYLVMVIPFTVAWIAFRPSMARIVLGTLLFAASSYALAVTFARAGYLGYAGAIFVLGIALTIHWMRQRARKPGRLAIATILALAGMAVLIPIVTGSYMQSRFATTKTDIAVRTHHWSQVIEMMDSSPVTALFGMGLGSFPKTYLYKGPLGSLPATFSYQREGDNGFVRLGSGRTLYLGQRVSVRGGENYTLSLDVRSSDEKATLTAQVCEKSELYSFQCEWRTLPATTGPGEWQHHEVTINSKNVGQRSWYARRPVVLSLHKSGAGAAVEADNVRLLDGSGRDLVANGDFSRGGDRWYFATDDHLPWHIKHLWVQMYFDQGLAGLLAFGIIVVIALGRLTAGAWRGDLFSATLLAALCGFLLVGLFDSLFDAPRLTTFFFLLLFLALRRASSVSGATEKRINHREPATRVALLAH